MRVRPDADSNVLFLNRFSKPLGQRGVQKVVEKYLELAEIRGASVHTLRHTFAAHHIAKGTDRKTVQKVMGHKDERSTSIYTLLADQITNRELREHAL